MPLKHALVSGNADQHNLHFSKARIHKFQKHTCASFGPLANRVRIQYISVGHWRLEPRIQMPQLRFGEPIGRHHEAHHRIGQHFLQKEFGQRHARQFVSGACMGQVGKRNGQGPCQSGMRCPGMKLYQHRRFPGFGMHVVRRRNHLGFDVVLSRREGLAKPRNGKWPGEDCNGLAGQVFHRRDPLPF